VARAERGGIDWVAPDGKTPPHRSFHGRYRAAGTVCVLCGGPVLLGHAVIVGDRSGRESGGVVCDLCHQVMVEACSICNGEDEDDG